ERARYGGGRETRQRCFALVRHEADEFVRPLDHALDLRDHHPSLQLDRDSLAVAAHRADAYAESVDGHRRRRQAEDLVALRARLEFFAAVAIAKVAIDPGEQAPCERVAESLNGHAACEGGSRAPV